MTTGGGKTLRLVIDVGENNAYLDAKAAQRIGVQVQPLGSADGSASPVQQGTVAEAHLGDVPFGDFPFMVLDLTPDTRADKKVMAFPADGALTFRSFRDRILQIDFATRTLRVSEPQKDSMPCPHACADLLIKRFGQYGPPTLSTGGFEFDGQPLDAQLDTLFTGTVLLYPHSLARLGLEKLKSKHKTYFPFVQNGVELSDTASEDKITFRGVPVLSGVTVYLWPKDYAVPKVQFDAIIGTGLLTQQTVTFDFKGMHLWIDAGANATFDGHR